MTLVTPDEEINFIKKIIEKNNLKPIPCLIINEF